jgi:hypothetical protein
MILTPLEIVHLGSNVIGDAQALLSASETAMSAINGHNAAKGAAPVNAGPFSVVRGALFTVIEQLQKHVAENTPVATGTPTATAPAPVETAPKS